jgi:hypothetical protein
MNDREVYGRKVREVWIAWCRERGETKGHKLSPFDEMPADIKEVDMRIGEEVAKLTISMWQFQLQHYLDNCRIELLKTAEALKVALEENDKLREQSGKWASRWLELFITDVCRKENDWLLEAIRPSLEKLIAWSERRKP